MSPGSKLRRTLYISSTVLYTGHRRRKFLLLQKKNTKSILCVHTCVCSPSKDFEMPVSKVSLAALCSIFAMTTLGSLYFTTSQTWKPQVTQLEQRETPWVDQERSKATGKDQSQQLGRSDQDLSVFDLCFLFFFSTKSNFSLFQPHSKWSIAQLNLWQRRAMMTKAMYSYYQWQGGVKLRLGPFLLDSVLTGLNCALTKHGTYKEVER